VTLAPGGCVTYVLDQMRKLDWRSWNAPLRNANSWELTGSRQSEIRKQPHEAAEYHDLRLIGARNALEQTAPTRQTVQSERLVVGSSREMTEEYSDERIGCSFCSRR
jgi:hypothetical protein